MEQKGSIAEGIKKVRFDWESDEKKPTEDLSHLLAPNTDDSSLKDDVKDSKTNSRVTKPPDLSLKKPSDHDNDSKVAELKKSKWSPENPQPIFLSCSVLSKEWKRVPGDVLESALFFFGSKRKWLFPQTEGEVLEARRQPGKYHKIDKHFLDLVRRKESRGEVHFLKKPNLHFGHSEYDPNAYHRVSEWLKGQGYPEGLQLEKEWWKNKSPQKLQYRTNPFRVIMNFTKGSHGYEEVKELVYQSSGGRLKPIIRWRG